MSAIYPLNERIYRLAGDTPGGTVIVPDTLAHEWLNSLHARGGKRECAHGHKWTIATARVRIRDRRDKGHGLSIERDCRVCKAEQYKLAVSRKRHQLKGGRLT